MVNESNQNERGQNLVLLAVIMIVLVALAALAIDGGFALSNRRKVQNAADAGALAGANALCAGNSDLARTQAIDYAINRNSATTADLTLSTKVITVTASILQQTFLAGIFGSDVLTTTATASAGCYAPCSGTSVLPVAWACHPPVGGSDHDDCAIQYGTVDQPGPLYIIMDSNKAAADYLCQDPPGSGIPSGALNCDLNGDGQNDYMVGGGRSWLDLDGQDGGHSVKPGWITDGFDGQVMQHLWLPASDGTAANLFHAAETRRQNNPYVIIPVFNDYTVRCRPDQISGGCYSQWHSGVDQIRPYNSGSADYYHIISFSLFKITCVSANKHEVCEGKKFLVDNGKLADNDKTIEGYFVEGYVPGLSGKCDYNAGTYTIYLNH